MYIYEWFSDGGYSFSKNGEVCTPEELCSILNNMAKLRKAVANYMDSEGCGCCEDTDAHEKHTKELAKLLDVPKYSDGSGYDFYQFADTK